MSSLRGLCEPIWLRVGDDTMVVGVVWLASETSPGRQPPSARVVQNAAFPSETWTVTGGQAGLGGL